MCECVVVSVCVGGIVTKNGRDPPATSKPEDWMTRRRMGLKRGRHPTGQRCPNPPADSPPAAPCPPRDPAPCLSRLRGPSNPKPLHHGIHHQRTTSTCPNMNMRSPAWGPVLISAPRSAAPCLDMRPARLAPPAYVRRPTATCEKQARRGQHGAQNPTPRLHVQ